MMDDAKDKTFPMVSLTDGDFKLDTLSKKDRDILVMGYKSGCCFKANGLADGGPSRLPSLLQYCCTEKYGGGLKICDEKGNVKMFSPILRNGNVLMIHSIETKGLTKEESKKVHELLCRFGEKVIEEAYMNGDDISFVLITDFHNLESGYTSGIIPSEKEFKVYDPNHKYDKMYNNLDNGQHVIAKKAGVKYEDIRYDYEVDKSYDSGEPNYITSFSISNEDLTIIEKMNKLKQSYILLSNESERLKEQKEESYSLSINAKNRRKEYNQEYQKLITRNNGDDKYSKYQRATKLMENIAKNNGTLFPKNAVKVIYTPKWYIAITKDGKLIGDSLDYNDKTYQKYLESFKENLSADVLIFDHGLPKDDNLSIIENGENRHR